MQNSDLLYYKYANAKQKVLDVARSWVGHEFNAGVSAQCARFVRSVFEEAGVPVANARTPDDAGLLPRGPFSPDYADSFAGWDVGFLVSEIDALKPGDLVMFYNTYGSYPKGVITHVGIFDENRTFIHRPTVTRPVERLHFDDYWRGHFAQARRPLAYDEKALKYFYHDEKASSTDRLHIKYFHHGNSTDLLIAVSDSIDVYARDFEGRFTVDIPERGDTKITLRATRSREGYVSRFYDIGGASTCYHLDFDTAGGAHPRLTYQSKFGTQKTVYKELKVLAASITATVY